VSASWVDEYVDKPLLERKVAHEGRIWDVVYDTFEIGPYKIVRDYVRHTGAVAVVAINENDEILTIRQYRQPVGAYLIEIPAGLLDEPDEDPVIAAQRELLEEASSIATEWSVLVDFFTSPGSTSEVVRIYLARDISSVEANALSLDDEESEIEIRWVNIEDAMRNIQQGFWQSPTLVLGVLAYSALRSGRDADGEWPARSHLLRTNRVHKLNKA